MKHPLFLLLLANLLASPANHGAATDRELELIAVLESAAGAVEKCSACQQLRTWGTARAVAALAAQLAEDRVGHAARYALEGLPYPEAGAALRTALDHTTGFARAGIIDSLGWRGDEEAVPLLAPLLGDRDVTLATAAATALGRIGGPDAVTTLFGVADDAPAEVRSAALEGLLQCAERLAAAGDAGGSRQLYERMTDRVQSEALHIAVWRGLILSHEPLSAQRSQEVLDVLAEPDHVLHDAALQVLRAVESPSLLQAGWRAWDTLPADAQLALLDAQLRLGINATTAIRTARTSPYTEVRVAAWEGLADSDDLSAIPLLAQAAARGETPERAAAAETLTRLRGTEVTAAFGAAIDRAEALEQAVLLQALGARGDTGAAPLLLRYTGDRQRTVRNTALASLRELAAPETLMPLLEVAADSASSAESEPVLQALYAVCRAEPDKAQLTRNVLAVMDRVPPDRRRHLLPLLAELATPPALDAAESAAGSGDIETAKEALRVLAQWPNAGPAPRLLELAQSNADPTLHALALRGAITVAAFEQDPARRLAWLRSALNIARRTEEKKQALGQIGRTPLPEALDLALSQLGEAAWADEAGLAALNVVEGLAASDPQLADRVAEEVLAASDAPEVVRRAWALRAKPQPDGPRIRSWLLSGPYRRAGVTGAQAVFDLVFPPEQTGEAVDWLPLPAGDQVNLAARFPGQDNCVAYLKTRIIAPEATSGAILLGSDDGVKVWLNGEVVHSNNVDRGEVADQDVAPIRLRQGNNELLLKISQGGGGWSVSARIVGPDGMPISGLQDQAR